jgi:AraC-like DNA-binding protein
VSPLRTPSCRLTGLVSSSPSEESADGGRLRNETLPGCDDCGCRQWHDHFHGRAIIILDVEARDLIRRLREINAQQLNTQTPERFASFVVPASRLSDAITAGMDGLPTCSSASWRGSDAVQGEPLSTAQLASMICAHVAPQIHESAEPAFRASVELSVPRANVTTVASVVGLSTRSLQRRFDQANMPSPKALVFRARWLVPLFAAAGGVCQRSKAARNCATAAMSRAFRRDFDLGVKALRAQGTYERVVRDILDRFGRNAVPQAECKAQDGPVLSQVGC